MARSRKPRDYAAEYAKRTRGTVKGSLERQRQRGHGAHLRPPGTTEAAVRREKEQDRVRREGGTTSRERQDMKRWFLALAKESAAGAEARGRASVTRADIEDAWEDFLRRWGSRDWSAFERLRHTIATWRLEAYGRLRFPLNESPDEIENDWVQELDDEFGLMLEENIWFLLWRSGKPPEGKAQAARRAA